MGDGRYMVYVLIVGNGGYCVIVGMIINYNVRYLKCSDGIFYWSRNVIGFWFVGRDDIVCVVNNEQIVRFMLCY